jgi:PAS domain S-box-containing protein
LGIYRANPSGNITMANKTVLKMFGYTSLSEMNAEIQKKDFYINNNFRENFKKILFEKGNVYGFEEEMYKKDGSLIYVRESATVYKDKSGKILYYDGTIEDITEKKKAEQATIAARKKAEQSEKIKTEFLRQMSHEIRTPINVIMNYLQLLRDEADLRSNEDREIKEAYGTIKYASKRLVRTIDLTLNSSELLTNSYKSNKRDINVYNEILLRVYGEHKKTAKFKKLYFATDKKAIYNFVYCDEYSVYNILDNLVDNAIRFTHEGSVVLKTENDTENNLIITISDTGIGISEEYMKVIYEPFTQEKAGSSREYDGTGLGMTLVKGYCKINNINIKIRSKKNSGTKVILLFNDTLK